MGLRVINSGLDKLRRSLGFVVPLQMLVTTKQRENVAVISSIVPPDNQ